MREIKFRGKTRTTEGEKWVYGYLYKVKSFFDQDENCYIRNEHITDFIVDKDTVGQYTGLKDKNGVEIYEGDIVYIIPEDEQGIVEWDEEAASFIVVFDNIITDFKDEWRGKDLEVIGDIYDDRH